MANIGISVQRMHVVRGSTGGYCFICIANEKLWLVSIFGDKKTALEYIHSLKGHVTDEKLKQFSDVLEQSTLPWSSWKDPIIIPYYAGCAVARAVDAFLYAQNNSFKPYTAWPVIGDVCDYQFFTYLADSRLWSMPSPENQYIYNGIIGCYENDNDPLLCILNSRSQWDNFLNSEILKESQVQKVYDLLGQSLIPEATDLEPVYIRGPVAGHLYQILRYELHINSVFEPYEFCSWGSSGKNFDMLLN